MQGQKRRVTRRYFSLIELLVVLTIMGLIAGIAGVGIIAFLNGAKKDTTLLQTKTFKQAVKAYYLDAGTLPSGLGDLVKSDGSTKWSGPYMEDGVLPKDPWGNDYQFQTPGPNNRDYDIFSYGADGTSGGEGDNADISCWPVAE